MCTTNLIAELKKSPMFHLSLSSKELFHSNMLAWIAEDEDTEGLFVEILNLFGITEEDKAKDIAEGLRGENPKYMVLREYKNFDLCICEKIKKNNDDSQQGGEEDNTNKDEKESEEDEYGYIPGRILLVLENKFKSIPYKAQLKEYQEKVQELNKEGIKNWLVSNGIKGVGPKTLEDYWEKYIDNKKLELLNKGSLHKQDTHFVLLSLAKDIYELQVNNNSLDVEGTTWHYVSYKGYSYLLNSYLFKKTTLSASELKGQLIKDYAEYVYSFCDYLDKKSPQNTETQGSWTNNSWTKTLASNRELKEIRMDDIWQKLIANHILIKLCTMGEKVLFTDGVKYSISTKVEDFIMGLKKKKKRQGPDLESVHVAAGFSRGTALIEIKIHIGDGCVFGVQIQNGLYKRFLETTKSRVDQAKTENGLKFFYNEYLEELNSMFRLNDDSFNNKTTEWSFKPKIFEDDVCPNEKNMNAGFNGFGGYGETFLAQWMKISDAATIEAVLDAMIQDCLEVRNKYPIPPNQKDRKPTNN